MKRLCESFFIFFTAITIVNGENLIIHLLHPWADEPGRLDHPLRIVSSESGWDMGSPMTEEGCSWYSYTFRTTPRTDNGQRIEFVSFIPTDTDERANRRDYTRGVTGTQLFMNQIFGNQPEIVTEVWMTIPDTTRPPVLSFVPPPNKIIHFLKPWDLGAPVIQRQDSDTLRMAMETDSNRCGWFSYRFYCDYANLKVRFVNSLLGTSYSVTGEGDSSYMDLSAELATTDSIWILPTPQPDGAPVVHRSFPGVTGNCGSTIQVGAILRDWSNDHPDFGEFWEKPECQGHQPGMVQKRLGADGNPVPTAHACIRQFDWFEPYVFNNGYTNQQCYNLTLKTNGEGLFEYDTNAFFPLSDFLYLDPEETIENPFHGDWANCSFSMELSAEFEYVPGQTFYFRGDDDVWVFIDSQLVVDIGGIHDPIEGAVDLDTLGLTPGETYGFKLFYAERFCGGSNFRMVTSIDLRSNSNLITKVTTTSAGALQYDIWHLITTDNLTCSSEGMILDTVKDPALDFFIEGPSFIEPQQLMEGTHFGGITIVGASTVILDTLSMHGLEPGDYLLSYYLRTDRSQNGSIPFTVHALPVDHFDLLTDSMTLDPVSDAMLDSIVIGYFDSTAQVYAVLRDSAGTFLGNALHPFWTSSNPAIATVEQSATDPSRCIITKVATGEVWVVVSDPAGIIKPDSVRVIAMVLPEYPVIISAIMLDTNADIIPDMLEITLSGTFTENQHLDSISFSYDGDDYVVQAPAVLQNGTSIRIPFTAKSGTNSRPAGRVTLCQTTETGSPCTPATFTDGVTPAIIAADVLENEGTDHDVLFLTFSEPLNPGTVFGRQLQLIRKGTADTVELNITRIIAIVNDSMLTVQTAPTDAGSLNVRAKAGDRLRLIPGSAGGTLADLSENTAHDLNRSVIIGFRPGAASISGAWYVDPDADGIINEVRVKFGRTVELSEFDTVTVQWKNGSFRLPSSAYTRMGDSLFAIDLRGNISAVTTSGAMNVSVEYRAVAGVSRSVTAIDSAAPVIISARLTPGAVTPSDERAGDTLVVAFSEAAAPFGTSPYLLSTRKDGMRYSFTLDYLGTGTAPDNYRFVVRLITPSSLSFASEGDTIWIDPSAGVADSGGITQTNPLNRRVLLQVDWPAEDWRAMIGPNPFRRDTRQPESEGGGAGTAIILTSTRPFDKSVYHADVTIFDAVGNVVNRSECTPFRNGFRMLWSGENRNGRIVGPGTYVAYVTVYNGTDRKFVTTLKIGFLQ
ncbi:MAG: fibro-slime domain-containing protein [Chitinispirillaceae bacterium]|nr:fibro-slime domain-containing protein [Chitinispirillaceae bacterium]